VTFWLLSGDCETASNCERSACLCRIATPVAAQGNTMVGQAGRL